MNVRRYATVAEFLPDVRAFLEREEAVAGLPLGLLLLGEPASTDEKERPFFVLVSREEEPVLLMMCTPPYNMILHCESDRLDALELMADHLIEAEHPLPGVNGTNEIANAFADIWTQRTGQPASVCMRQRIYTLTEVIPPTGVSGRMAIGWKGSQRIQTRPLRFTAPWA